ncbi:alkaline phosphatase D family protein [Polaromonas sp. SM01]|uniref:alkaline phosphatase D family protein n=1 Tax=Polaromonas sp. SM01 TaxID=3085630 RepID=UPI002980B357|nr:alkaline phosphatase D family protein [Polaromonas sp. SM01]MDW5444869.1 alkaline phosphatase D family protein [Polaromonas sp. SM01]
MTPSFSSRRHLLQLATASAATLWLPRSAWSQPRLGSNPFALGVASGSPTHDSVVLWTRLMRKDDPAPVTVRWEVAHDEHFSRVVQRGQAQALAGLAHAVHVEVPGLEADRWYFYRFLAGDAVSATGRTRTFPAPDAVVARLRLAYASCQRWEHGYFSAYRHMREENLDLVMFLGDYIYEYPGASKAVRAPTGGWVLTLDDYRQRYALHKGDADLQAMHAACPWLVSWDDHEVQNDYAGLSEGNSGVPVPDFAARRAAAYQAFYEHMPVRLSVLTRAVAGLASGAEMRIYQRQPYGRLASLYMLDGRQYKDTQVCSRDGKKGSSTLNPANCPSWNDPARSMLGRPQEQWLDAELGKAASRESGWNVLGQQSLFGQRDFHKGPGQVLWNDGWDGYAAARTRLTGALRQHTVANPVLLGGDVHENWVGHVKANYADAASAAIGVEFCGTSITSRSAGNAKIPAILAENPHFVFADSERKGYGVVEFTPRQLSTSLRVVSDVTQADSGIETLAAFVVQAGRPVIEKA